MTREKELEVVNSEFEMPSYDSFTDAELAALKRACKDDALISAFGRISIVSNRELAMADDPTKVAMAAGVSCAYAGIRGMLKAIRLKLFDEVPDGPSVPYDDGVPVKAVQKKSADPTIIDISDDKFREMQFSGNWKKDQIYRVVFEEKYGAFYYINGENCTSKVKAMFGNSPNVY